MNRNRKPIRLTESQLNKVIRESVERVLKEAYRNGDSFGTIERYSYQDFKEGDIVYLEYYPDRKFKVVATPHSNEVTIEDCLTGEILDVYASNLVHEDNDKYIESLYLNHNLPDKNEPWSRYKSKRYWSNANTDEHPGYTADKESWIRQQNVKRYWSDVYPDEHPGYTTDKERWIRYRNGEANFINDDRYSADAFARYGKALQHDYYWGTTDYPRYDAEKDMEDFNNSTRKKSEKSYNNALKSADKRPLHRKGSLNRAFDED